MDILQTVKNSLASLGNGHGKQANNVPGERGNYAYVTTRLKSRAERMIPLSQFDVLLSMSVHEIAAFVSNMHYGEEVLTLGMEYSGMDLVEYSLQAMLAREIRDVHSFCRSDLRRVIERRLITFDAENLKAVLRGRATGVDESELRRVLVPIGNAGMGFDMNDWLDLYATPEETEFVEKLSSTPFHSALNRIRGGGAGVELHAPQSRTIRLASEIEAIDFIAYTMRRHAIRGKKISTRAMIGIMELEIDFINLITLLVLKRNHLKPEAITSHFLAGGRFCDIEKLRSLAALDDVKPVIEAIRGMKAIPELEPALAEAEASGDLVHIERTQRSILMRRLREKARIYPLSPLVIVEYIMLKQRESNNIRIIARGKNLGLKEDEIRSLLWL